MTGAVLIVDDERTLVETISDHLAMDGFDVARAGSAEHALDLTRVRAFDVVVADLKLPGMSGLDLLRALGESGRAPAVILMTAYGTMDLIVDAFRRGLFDFHEKPLRLDALSDSVKRAVAARSAPAAVTTAVLPTRALGERSRRLGRVRVEVAGDPSAASATAVWCMRAIDRSRVGFVWGHVAAGSRAGTLARLLVRGLAEVLDLGTPADAIESTISCLSALDCRSALRAIAVATIGPDDGSAISGASLGDAGLFRLNADDGTVERVGLARGDRVTSWRTAFRLEDALVLLDARLTAAGGQRVDDALGDAARAVSEGTPDPARRLLGTLTEPTIEAPVVVAVRVGAVVRAGQPLRLRLPPSRAALIHAREATEQFLTDSSLDEGRTHEVVIAVQEALLNCIRWAYPGGDGPVSLTLSDEGDRLRACVRDEGLGFDVEETLARSGEMAADPLRRGGRGLALMRRCVDRFDLVSAPGEGTRVVLEKRRDGSAAARGSTHEAIATR